MSRSVTLRASLPSGQFSSESKLAEPTQKSKTLKTSQGVYYLLLPELLKTYSAESQDYNLLYTLAFQFSTH